eukprot:scaffold2058_cov115-Isochrysis_galbana.AAC.11
MAPGQLRLELNEVDITADKGSKRVPADSTDKSSTQSFGSRQGKCVQQRPLRESQHPPILPQLRLSTTTPSGVDLLAIPDTLPTPMALTTTPICTKQIVPVSTTSPAPSAAESQHKHSRQSC